MTKSDIRVRYCDECGCEMWEGYCIDNGSFYYCCDECLHKNMTQEEFEERYRDGDGDSYYTDWFDEENIYYKEDQK